MHRLIRLLTLVPLLIACTIDDGTTSALSTSEICFDVEAAPSTRGNATDFDTGKTFRVFAWQGNSVVIGPEIDDPESNLVSFANGAWRTGRPYFWPEDETATVDFYAVYPKDTPFSTASRTIDYTIQAIDGLTDIYYATASVSKNGSTSGDAVGLTFHHALSRVAFRKTEAPGVSATVTAIRLVGLKSQSSFDFTGWSTPDVATDYTLGINEARYLLPQTLAAGCKAIISCEASVNGEVYLTGDQEVELSGAWVMGMQYTYTLQFTSVGITLAPITIASWEPAGSDGLLAETNFCLPIPELQGPPDGLEAVDLGLSVKWANMNIGATAAEEYGLYFAWGETHGYPIDTSRPFDYQHYLFRDYEQVIWDENYNLLPEYDAAVKYWGGDWRMPTKDEIIELAENTDITTETCNGIFGFRLTSKKGGYTDKSIFIPAAGFFWGQTNNQQGEEVLCLSSSLFYSIDSEEYYYDGMVSLYLSPSYPPYGWEEENGYYSRYYGGCIRPVIGK